MFARTLALTLAAVAAANTVGAQVPPPAVQQVIVGQNVNMVGGPASYDPTRDPALVGDPFLQRQNEPSLAPSSRNACHLLAGANDYRAVDLEEAFELETADAWLGVFKSLDCGRTWSSTLLPGHPADDSPAGVASPLKDGGGAPLQAAADATVRAGTSGMFYYSGIAFNRTPDNSVGRVFVARFIDNNNTDGGDPIKYLGTIGIDRGTSGQFLDKPWIATDLPRDPRRTCRVDGQTFPAGNVYIAYSAFLGDGNNPRTKILFSRSLDCGATWSIPTKLSERFARNQGTAMAVDPGTGTIYVAWREFARAGDASSVDGILITKSTNEGKTWTPAARLPFAIDPFDQAATPVTFRTLMFPTMTVVPSEADGRAKGRDGRVYLAWAARGYAPLRPGQTRGDSRIVYSSGIGGTGWTTPRPADDYPGSGHQIIPALTFAGGKLALAFYDLRETAAQLHEDYIVEGGLHVPAGRRHTMDVRSAIAGSACLSAGQCAFTAYAVSSAFEVSSASVSEYVMWAAPGGQEVRVQVQFNRPNLQLFRKGTHPFIGDYIDIQGPVYLPDGAGRFVFNSGATAARPATMFHVAWGDNRDVKRPGDLNWQHFTPGVPGPSFMQNPVCYPEQTGIRNQNVYTAQLRPGVMLTAPLNTKRIAGLQRSFVVVAHNATGETRTYRLTVAPPPGIVASFDQFSGFGVGSPAVEITAVIPPRSSASRTVFVGLADGSAVSASVPVRVDEIVACAPGAACPADSDLVYLNPDFESPDFESPDFESVEFHSPDFESPDFESPDFESPDFESFVINTSIRTPDFESPDFESPDFESPDFESPDFESPDFESGVFSNPDFESPDFESPDFESSTVSDLTWPVYNVGNTTSAYKANLYVDLPSDPDVRYQLVVRRIYPSPVAACVPFPASSPPRAAQNQVVVNIVDPDTDANLRDRAFNNPDRTNATFYLAPGEAARVTLRAYCRAGASCPIADASEAVRRVSLGIVAQAANCVICDGPACTGGDQVGGATECRLEDDLPPKDIYDPVPPQVIAPSPGPEAIDADYSGSESIAFSLQVTDNFAVAAVSCAAGSSPLTLVSHDGDTYVFSGLFPVGASQVRCTASDLATDPPKLPNETTVTFEVIVHDVSPPVFDPNDNPGAPFVPGNPAEATGPAGAQVFFTNPTATDPAGGPVTVICASAGGLTSGSVFPIGTTPIDCTATNTGGIATAPTHLFDVRVADTQAPRLTLPSPVTAGATGAAGANVVWAATAVDLVDGAVQVACEPASGTMFPIGSTSVTCRAADRAGNLATGSFAVTVADLEAPVLALPAPIVAAATGSSGASVAWVASAADQVDAVPVVTCDPASGSVFRIGVTPVTCTAADAAGNVAAASFTVTVVDITPPVELTAVVNPAVLWPPDGRTVTVVVSGVAVDNESGAARIHWTVLDEYRLVEPSGEVVLTGNGGYSFQVPLVAERRGNDKDGRHYTIRITVRDAAGNGRVPANPPVVNVHDQSSQ